MRTENKLSWKQKVSYGVGDLSLNIAYTTLGFYFIFFLVNVAALPVQWAGAIFLIARIWDAVTDYSMGIISDKTKHPLGRRRIFIITGAVPFAVMFAMLWIVPSTNRIFLFIYYLMATILFNTFFTIVSVPYNALMPELTRNYDERTSLSGYRMAFSFVGNLVAAAGVSLIIDVIYPGKSFYKTSFPVMGLILAVLIIGFLLVTFFGTRETISEDVLPEQNFLKTLKEILSLREFRLILGLFLLNMTGLDVFMALVIFFLKDVLLIPEEMTFIIMGLPLISAVGAVPFWIYLGEKLGKPKAYIHGVILFSFMLILFNTVPRGSIILSMIFAVLVGISISALQVLPFAILPDIVEIDELKNGVRREGAFYGISTFLYKTASALAVAGVSGILGLFGYSEGNFLHQSKTALTAIRVTFTLGPVLFLLFSLFLAAILPISRKSHVETLESLRMDN